MALASRLPAAEDGLFALLDARRLTPGNPLEGAGLSHGWPGDLLEREHVWIEETATAEQEQQVTSGTGSGGTKLERGTLTVAVWVLTRGNSYIASRDRAHALAGEIEDAVRDEFDLGQPAIFGSDVRRIRRGPAPAELDTRGIFLEIDVEFVAYLTA